MAGQELGSIQWVVDADTAPAVNSVKQFDQTVNKVEGTLQGLDTKVTQTASAVNKGMSSMGRNAGQAGIQIQQFVGQVQGGQSAMLALSQQAADIGIVMGAPMVGVLVALGASLAGMLLPNLFSTTDALEGIEKATERVRAAMTLSIDGVANYSDSMKMLKNMSEQLLQVKLASLVADQKSAMDTASRGLQEALDDSRGSWTTWRGHIEDVFGNTTKASQDAMKAISSATRQLQFGVTEEGIIGVEKALQAMTEAGANNTAKGRELIRYISDLVIKYREGELTIAQLNKALEDSDTVIEDAGKAADKYTAILGRLEVQSKKLRSEQMEIQKRLLLEQAERDGVSESVREQLAAYQDKIIANQLEEEATRSAAKAQTEANKAAREAAKIAREKQRAEEEAKRAMDQQISAREAFEGVAQKAILDVEQDPEVILAAQRDAKLKELRDAYMASDLADTQMFVDASKAIWQSYYDELDSMAMANAAMLAGSVSGVFGELAGIMKNAQGEQSSAYRAMFALSKGFAIAQAGLNLSTAISNAAALPWPANIPAMAQAAASGAQLLSQIGSASYGGREHGGSVTAGVPYEVGEKNKPELLMIPGNNGKVFSNSDVGRMMRGGDSGGTIVNVHNYSGAPVTQSASKDPLTRQDVIDIVVGESANTNSRMMRNVTSNTSATNNANSGRRI